MTGMEAATKALKEYKAGDPNLVAVSDALFAEKHKLFDEGARFVYTGCKDGTDRKWIRLRDKLIVLAGNNKQFLIPLSVAMSQGPSSSSSSSSHPPRPLTKFAARTMDPINPEDFQWIYGEPETFLDPVTGKERKNVIGYVSKGKSYMDLDKPYRVKECGHCHAIKTTSKELLVCSRCKTFMYCSTDCQRNAWPTHKPLCIKLAQRAASPSVDSAPPPVAIDDLKNPVSI